MKTLYTVYEDEKTGITGKICGSRIDLRTSNNQIEFVFKNSKPETVKLIAESMLRFVKLVPEPVKVKITTSTKTKRKSAKIPETFA